MKATNSPPNSTRPKGFNLTRRPAAIMTAAMALLATSVANAQTTRNVTTMSELSFALSAGMDAPANSGAFTINLQNDLTADTTWNFLTAANSGSPVVIEGNGHTIDFNQLGPGFFVAGGNLTFQNLTILNATAVGGTGGQGGGGGMGAGAALFVMDGSSVTGANITEATEVTVRNVTFLNNNSTGGGSTVSANTNDSYLGGGGGLGGNGGSGFGEFLYPNNGVGGGGGIGPTASGGSAQSDGGASMGGTGFYFIGDGAGNGNLDGDGSTSSGGPQGGGGGAANFDPSLFSADDWIAAGGGGIGGQSGSYNSSTGLVSGGNGGFGGGGGSAVGGSAQAGSGGFGGGGAAALEGPAGNGGFGGGGGASSGDEFTGSGGFGAGDGGGGGLAAGGAIFAMKGVSLNLDNVSFSGNDVTAGSGGHGSNGQAIGQDLFLGSDVTITIASGETLTIDDNSFGGAAFDGAGDDPDDDAKGRLTVSGGGTFLITGNQSFAGTTFVNGSTVTLAAESNDGPSVVPQGVSGTSDYQVLNSGAALNINASSSNIAPITQSNGTVAVNGNNNTIAPNAFTPSPITDAIGLSGGTFSIGANQTTIAGSTSISGTGNLTTTGTGTTFNGPVSVSGGQFHSSAAVEIDSLTVSGGIVDLSNNLSLNGDLIMTGGSLTVGGRFSQSGSTAVNLTGGAANFRSGDSGADTQYTIANGAEATFATSFENASFSVGTNANPNASRLTFVGFSGLSEFTTEAESITVGSNGILDLDIQGDPSSEYSAVNVGNTTIAGGAQIVFDLMNDFIPAMNMIDFSGTLAFDLQSFQTITFTLDQFADSLAPGQSRTYTIIGSVSNLDLGTSTDILSQFVFDAGTHSGLTGEFVGLDAANNPNLQLTITNAVPEPGTIAFLSFGFAIASLANWLRRRS